MDLDNSKLYKLRARYSDMDNRTVQDFSRISLEVADFMQAWILRGTKTKFFDFETMSPKMLKEHFYFVDGCGRILALDYRQVAELFHCAYCGNEGFEPECIIHDNIEGCNKCNPDSMMRIVLNEEYGDD